MLYTKRICKITLYYYFAHLRSPTVVSNNVMVPLAWKEGGICLFKHILNTFLEYTTGYMVKDHSWAICFNKQQAFFYIPHPRDKIVNGALDGMRNSSVGPPRRIDLMTH